MTDQENEVFEDALSEVEDLGKMVNEITENLSCAGSCEGMSDLRACLKQAKREAAELIKAIDRVLAETKGK